jgi:hypothetical protein
VQRIVIENSKNRGIENSVKIEELRIVSEDSEKIVFFRLARG